MYKIYPVHPSYHYIRNQGFVRSMVLVFGTTGTPSDIMVCLDALGYTSNIIKASSASGPPCPPTPGVENC